MKPMIVLVIITLMIEQSFGSKIVCPKLTCLDEYLYKKTFPAAEELKQQQLESQFIMKNECFVHDKSQPVKNIYAVGCSRQVQRYGELIPPVVCDFDLKNGQFSWIDEKYQNLISSGTYGKFADESQLFYKRTTASCRQSNWLEKRLLGGRVCQDSFQCISGQCLMNNEKQMKLCTARQDKQSCANHYDCDAGMFCEQKQAYPFTNQCTKLRTSYEQCKTTQECQHNLYCWYAVALDTTKKCLPMYSQQEDYSYGWAYIDAKPNQPPKYLDYQKNGQYCKTGLAYRSTDKKACGITTNVEVPQCAVCTKTFKITQETYNSTLDQFFEKELDQGIDDQKKTYSCDPTFNDKGCRIYYLKNQFFEVPCRCALDGTQTGFCDTVIGTWPYQKALGQMKSMHEKSNCHTYDRLNFRAQMNKACSSVEPEILEAAAIEIFKIEHWPYAQNQTDTKSLNYPETSLDKVAACMSRISLNSWENIMQERAIILRTSVVALISMAYSTL